ncbi:MAG TPA: TIGR03085 family metal-binding protein [Micromonosporaceae bacterium]
MAKPNFARAERSAVVDLLTEVGPDQPTLCAGWQTRDLAAHLVTRDRRPDAAAGIIIKRLAGYTDRLRNAAAARPWDVLTAQVGQPPRLSMAGIGALDRLTNTTEFFVHHEDIRRAQPGWTPRPLDPGLGAALAGQVKMAGKLRLRRFPAKITINMPGYGEPFTTGAGGPDLDVSGDPGEMTLLLSGRQQASRVNIVGPENLVDRLRSAPLGV